jgi:hypothetical protein
MMHFSLPMLFARSALILRSAPQERVSKDKGGPHPSRREPRSLLRMRPHVRGDA